MKPKDGIIDLRGAKLLKNPNERDIFMPPTVVEVRRVRAANLMNKTPELTKAWANAMEGLVSAMDEGADVAEGVVPRNGADILSLLGFHVQYVGAQGEADLVRVCLTDPFVTSKVLS